MLMGHAENAKVVYMGYHLSFLLLLFLIMAVLEMRQCRASRRLAISCATISV